MEGTQAFAVEGVVDCPPDPARPDQLPSPKHPEVPAQARLADPDGIGELEHGDLRGTCQELHDTQPRDAGQRLVMGTELA